MTILIVWFLVSIVVGLVLGRVFAAAHNGPGTGHSMPQHLPSPKTQPARDTVVSSL